MDLGDLPPSGLGQLIGTLGGPAVEGCLVSHPVSTFHPGSLLHIEEVSMPNPAPGIQGILQVLPLGKAIAHEDQEGINVIDVTGLEVGGAAMLHDIEVKHYVLSLAIGWSIPSNVLILS